jgi:hypothetical protein
MASAATLRRQNDIELVNRLVERSGGLLQLRQAFGASSGQLKLRSNLPTSADETFPMTRPASTDFTITLPARYPFVAPVVHIETAIFHANVFTNGTVCLGTQWQASEGLDLFISRVARLLTYDPLLLNLQSPANGAAARWYLRASTQNPALFPTVQRAQHQWLFDPRAEKTIIHCPACGQSIRLPSGKSGTIACPKCKHEFEART